MFEWNAIKPAIIRNRTRSKLITFNRMVVQCTVYSYTIAELLKVLQFGGAGKR